MVDGVCFEASFEIFERDLGEFFLRSKRLKFVFKPELEMSKRSSTKLPDSY